eukprot:1484542-Rhodomonas_salina.1
MRAENWRRSGGACGVCEQQQQQQHRARTTRRRSDICGPCVRADRSQEPCGRRLCLLQLPLRRPDAPLHRAHDLGPGLGQQGRLRRRHVSAADVHAGFAEKRGLCSVSYTHLTLPTICSV